MAEPSAPSASNPSYEDLVEAWNTICRLLGADGPDEAIARIQTLTSQLEALDERSDLPDDLITLSEFEQVLTRLHQQIADLRERNATLEARLNALTDEEGQVTAPHALLDALNVTTYDEAAHRIQTMKERLGTLYEDREAIREAGHDDAEGLIEAANALQRENERLRENARNTSPDTEVLQSASAIRMVLGISNIKEAEDFVDRLDAFSASVRRALDHLGMDVPRELNIDHAEDVASYLDVLASQVDRLAEAPLPDDEMFEAAETLDAISATLGISSAADAREMEAMVRSLTEDLNDLAEEREVLRAEGLTAQDAVSMIHSMEEQLDDLYVQHDVNEPNGTLPPGLQDTLGVESVEEARRIAKRNNEIDAQVASLYEDQEQLEELGIESIEEAVHMIRNMNEQLMELYENVEARAAADASIPDTQQDTFQQLEALYTRQEKLQSELGVSDPDAIIQMVEDMNAQLETIYEDYDASLQSATEEAPDADPDAEDLDNEDLDDAERFGALIDSMVQQLEALYSEKETLSDEGFDSAEEATTRIQHLRDEIEALRTQAAEPSLGKANVDPDMVREWVTLKEELGIEEPYEIRTLIASAPAETEAPAPESPTEDLPTEAADHASPNDGPSKEASLKEASPDTEWHAAPALADAEFRATLPTMDADARNDLDLAAIQLDNEGRLLTLNDAAYALPLFDRLRSKEDANEAHFFFDLAPSAATDAFYGRFHTGIEQEWLDARFPHLFSAPSHPPFVALVHLYYDSTSGTAWILLRTA